MSSRYGLRIGRYALGATGYTLAAGAMMIAAMATHSFLAILAMSVAVAAVMFTLGAA